MKKKERLIASPELARPMAATMEALGQSESFLAFQERLSRVASVERPVLLLGERGTGKELAATRLHYLSGRWQGPLVTLNCAALTPSLIESELFGYERGAFTGAQERRKGRFEAAHGERCFWTRSETFPLKPRKKFCGWWNTAAWSGWGAPKAWTWMCESSRRPMRTS